MFQRTKVHSPLKPSIFDFYELLLLFLITFSPKHFLAISKSEWQVHTPLANSGTFWLTTTYLPIYTYICTYVICMWWTDIDFTPCLIHKLPPLLSTFVEKNMIVIWQLLHYIWIFNLLFLTEIIGESIVLISINVPCIFTVVIKLPSNKICCCTFYLTIVYLFLLYVQIKHQNILV